MKIDTLNWTPPLPASPLARPVLHLDLSETNPALKRVPVDDPVVFGQWIRAQVAASGCDWALGGYAEDRAIYSMSPVFADGDATRHRDCHRAEITVPLLFTRAAATPRQSLPPW